MKILYHAAALNTVLVHVEEKLVFIRPYTKILIYNVLVIFQMMFHYFQLKRFVQQNVFLASSFAGGFFIGLVF